MRDKKKNSENKEAEPVSKTLVLKAGKIIDKLSAEYPKAKTHLDFENPFQLLISTILAAQCRDTLINEVMGELYKKYKAPSDIAKANPEMLQKELSKITFFRQKTKSIQKASQELVDNFNGKVPQTMEELTSLAGVGRKTANAVLGNAFGKPAIIMDTHVIRVSQRLGLTENSEPDKIEADLKNSIPEGKQTRYSLIIGEHGRSICAARKPKCEECVVNSLCDYYSDVFLKENGVKSAKI